jgi:hypothetical protein
MPLNWIGVVAALATFLGIWAGHVAVRKVEYRAPGLRLPMTVALAIGLVLETVALVSSDTYVSGMCGILGMTALFDALEFRRQFKRVKKGHAPANPHNPRHTGLLAEGKATTIDWLKHEPMGCRVSEPEARALLGKGPTA